MSNESYAIADILDEFLRQQRGECTWCELGINHPPYSPCPEHWKELARNGGQVKPVTAPKPARTEIARVGKNGEFSLHLATTEDDRLKCWHLVYEQYLALGYTERKDMEYRYSLHDALPDTGTFLVEAEGKSAGTVTVFPDSPLGLPADEIFKEEIDALRDAGRTPVEIGRLTIDKEHMNDRTILTTLFDILSLYSRCILGATDLVITVNPSHQRFYERMLLFETIGTARTLGSVCDAPAVLMRLDLELQKTVIRWAHGEGALPEDLNPGRTFYGYFSSEAEEEERVARLRRSRRMPTREFIRQYFIWLKPLIPSLPSPLRYFMDKCYPGYGLKAVPPSGVAA